MKIGLFYVSLSGTTKKCAMMIKEQVPNVDLMNLDAKVINLDDYDYIIIGTPILMGRFPKQIRKFLKNNKEKLMGKTAIFLCRGFKIDLDKTLSANLDYDLYTNLILAASFGGEIHLDKLKGLKKFLVRMITKTNNYVEPKLDFEAIGKFIDNVKKLNRGEK